MTDGSVTMMMAVVPTGANRTWTGIYGVDASVRSAAPGRFPNARAALDYTYTYALCMFRTLMLLSP